MRLCKVTPVILHGVVSPERRVFDRKRHASGHAATDTIERALFRGICPKLIPEIRTGFVPATRSESISHHSAARRLVVLREHGLLRGRDEG